MLVLRHDFVASLSIGHRTLSTCQRRIIGRVSGGLDFTNYFLGLTPAASQAPTYDAAKKAGATVGYGTFITISVNFIIIAFVLFLIIRGINRMMRKEQDAPPPPAPPTKEQVLLTEIRDLLKGRV